MNNTQSDQITDEYPSIDQMLSTVEYTTESVPFQSLIETTDECVFCGGVGLELIRIGSAYPYFDQSDYDLVPCSHCQDTSK